MIASLLLCCAIGAPTSADAAHARAQRSARIARFHSAWEAAESKPRELAVAQLAAAADRWPTDAELDAACATLVGRAEPLSATQRALQELADALDPRIAPGWADGVSGDGAVGAFEVVVELGREPVGRALLEGPLTVRLLAPRDGAALASVTTTVGRLAGLTLAARIPIEVEVGLELAIELEHADGDRIERAISRRVSYALLPDARERLARLPRRVERALPRVDVPSAVRALEEFAASGLQQGITRDPLLLLGALELNELIAAQGESQHHGPDGLRLCGPLELVADSPQHWIGWQAGPRLERVVWFWSSGDQPFDSLFVGSDALSLEWQRVASGRGWLLVANEPRAEGGAENCLAELRAAFPRRPITLVARGAVAIPALAVEEIVRSGRVPPPIDASARTPCLWLATDGAEHVELPVHVTRVDVAAPAFLADPRVPRELDAWRQAREHR